MHTIAPLATITGMNALQIDSEGRIVEVVLGTEFLAIIKLCLTTGASSSHGKSVQATIWFVILPFMTLLSRDRLAIAR